MTTRRRTKKRGGKNFSMWSGEPWFESVGRFSFHACDICGNWIVGPATVRMRVVVVDHMPDGRPLGYLRVEHRNGPTMDIVETDAEQWRRLKAAGWPRCPE